MYAGRGDLVSYFDERQNDSALIAFDLHGKRTWALRAETYALDCYALCAAGDEVWATTYPDFPILRSDGKDVELWANDLTGARAIAGNGKHVILAGGYELNKDRVALLSLGAERAQLVAEFRWSTLLDRSAFVCGRDGVLHVIVDGCWTRLAISDWLASLARATR